MVNFFRRLKKLNPFARRPKGIPKVAAVHNLQQYAAQFSSSLKDDVMDKNSPKLPLAPTLEEESSPFFPKKIAKYSHDKTSNEDEVACSSYIRKTKELPNMPASFFETCSTFGPKMNGQPTVSFSINQSSSSLGQNFFGGSSSKPVAQNATGGKREISFEEQIRLAFSMENDKFIDYEGVGYGKNLEVLPGCSTVPRTPVQKQTVPLKAVLRDMKKNKEKVCVGGVHILRCIHHPSRQQDNGNQSSSNGLPPPLDMQPGLLINCATEEVSVPRRTTPPRGHGTNTVDEVGVDAMTLIYHEVADKGKNCRTIIVPPPTVPPAHGFLNDHEIVVSLQKYKGTMIVPKEEENVSVPKSTMPPPGHSSS